MRFHTTPGTLADDIGTFAALIVLCAVAYVFLAI